MRFSTLKRRRWIMRTAIIITSLMCCSSARDSMTLSSPLSDEHGDTLVSDGGTFQLGFFSPNGSSGSDHRRYLGIWYHDSDPQTVVWVANRDHPVLDVTGVLTLTQDGNLKVLDKAGKSYWSTNLEESSHLALKVQLLDTGNLVVARGGESGEAESGSGKMILWQSFDYPTDTFLPGMKMDENMTLTSWRSDDDPSPGNYSFQLDQEGQYQFVVWRRSIRYWKSGVSGKFITSDDMPYSISYFLSNFTTSIDNNASVPYLTSSMYIDTRLIMSSWGQVQYLKRDSEKVWAFVWAEPRDRCSVYNMCGDFGSCNSDADVVCKCLPGFSPSSPDLWNLGDFSGGCIRKSILCNKGSETFLGLKAMKVGKPDSEFVAADEMECKKECLNSCQCQAYSFEEGESAAGKAVRVVVCWIWSENLNNLQDGYDEGRDLFVRIAVSDIESTARNCEICGTNLIPYPLSTGSQCGDPMYRSFYCNTSTGTVNFKSPSGTYQVTQIIPESRKFLIRSKQTDSCKVLAFNRSLPFHLSSSCRGKTSSKPEIEISWEPPPEPTCITSTDCTDWPDSTCSTTLDGRRCLCKPNFRWNPLLLNCTKGKKHEVLSSKKVPPSVVISITFACILVLIALLSTVAFIYIQRRNSGKKKGNWSNIRRYSARQLYDSERQVKELIDSGRFKEDSSNGIDVPFYNLESILAATDNFSNINKLGQGGFGLVYKGKFPGGQVLAVKRLSSFSGQGFEEFKNEVILIAKLQHRNLVRLLGYCVEGDEKILLYEYMPNKSLDSFIFDRTLCMSLDWNTRFKIILGIARGLLYLHQDSRLRIVHRDLKTSNILLDEEMNPKISDFGLARIFGVKEISVNTNRVVGTYGYMSPEYALDGFFSDKSDVFSFGVVVLEVLSGKRNTGFYQAEQGLSLLGYAWSLWKEEKSVDLMDPTLHKSCNMNEYLRCISVGLLCVQEDPNDRPTMSNAVFMLGNETATLPTPKQPAFVMRRCPSSGASTSSKLESCSFNELTVTLVNGR
ncbi:LOW QUALITY PROTEIN: G-type lectin S-receptor-like serine/threonine-protein kinase At4g03230 [Eucalyptus grandis]|uniref:LOW QUALITY PROTEIN: G-type lectin S-receptor-like serine/threonine-protein kinase At4g03230 n=1 Tax=Eucalyptus grandis TaxID=71139 RepID=UPI00192EE649|nr:LOW QUALITY PROTEIN: G-type lectin S-receptor-like serine/threonine-protein kinase At4g03230 [Eucalyptus grandis]